MSIKHLKPRSKEEIREQCRDLSPADKFMFGLRNNLKWLKIEAIKEFK